MEGGFSIIISLCELFGVSDVCKQEMDQNDVFCEGKWYTGDSFVCDDDGRREDAI